MYVHERLALLRGFPMIATAATIDDRPCAVRYPRGDGVGVTMPEAGIPLEIGKGRIITQGSTVALLSLGTRLAECIKAAEMLAAQGISATIADARFAKPLDRDLILRLAREHARSRFLPTRWHDSTPPTIS